MDRRDFLRRSAVTAGGRCSARSRSSAWGQGRRTPRGARRARAAGPGVGYGPLARMADQRGVEVLALPAGFSYVTFGHIGAPMSDGTPTPLALDGMAAFAGPRGGVRLIRNHEDRNLAGAGQRRRPTRPFRTTRRAAAATSTLDYDPRRRRLVADYVSLSGTTINCAGGIGLPPAGLDQRRGDRRRARSTPTKLALPRAPRLLLRGPARARARRGASARGRSRRWAASATRPWPSTSGPASST